jgi:hypothetical protein
MLKLEKSRMLRLNDGFHTLRLAFDKDLLTLQSITMSNCNR